MKALLFPGQGSQSVGMAREFHNEFKIVKTKTSDKKYLYIISVNISKINQLIGNGKLIIIFTPYV